MTLVRMDVGRPAADGLVAADGWAAWQPTRRRVQDTMVVLPASFSVKLAAGLANVEVAPSSPNWCWKVVESVSGGITRYVSVPDVPTIAYTDLVDVDPATLEPSAEPTAAWWAALENAQIGVSATVDPDDPDLLILHYPSWMLDPEDPLILFLPIQEA